MDTEIELKYLVLDNDIATKINSALAEHKISYKLAQKNLTNIYFDTPALDLRKADIGLRIRGNAEGQLEQTIKTAGTVVGGLHQRPEYNVDVTSKEPNLSLFADEIWPEKFDVQDVQQQLAPLFETNFSRNTWLIEYGKDTLIELAFDQGEIVSNSQSETINEIELELVQGQRSALFSLAKLLFSCLTMRPGTLSKAARGYGLVFGRVEPHISSASTELGLTSHMTVMQSFNVGFAECLAQLQQLMSQFEQSPSLSRLKEISDCLALTRHGLWLYEEYLPSGVAKSLRKKIKTILKQIVWVETAKQIKELTKKTGNYRKKIENSQSLLSQLKHVLVKMPDFAQVSELLHSEEFNLLQLEMLELVLTEFDEHDELPALMDLAPSWLSLSLDDLYNKFTSDKLIGAETYLENHNIVIRSLLTGSWFGSLFVNNDRMEFRGPWLDIHHGIDELETLFVLKSYLADSEDSECQKLINWLEDKVENLLGAIEHSRTAGLSLQPYWLA